MLEDSTDTPVGGGAPRNARHTTEVADHALPTAGATSQPHAILRWGLGVLGVVGLAGALYIIPAVVVTFGLGSLQAFGAFLGGATDWLSSGATSVQFAYMALVEALTLVLARGLMQALRVSWQDIGWVAPRQSPVWPFITAFGVYFGSLITIGLILPHTPIDTSQSQEIGFQNVQGTTQLLMVFVSLVVLPPLIEEIVFRGFLYTWAKRYVSVLSATMIVSVVFGIAHLQLDTGNAPLWIAAIDTFILSFVLVRLREQTGSLWPSIALHGLKNFIAFSTLFLLQ